jgi:hypothetical protein
MNPWELFLLIVGWTLVVLAILILIAILSGFLVWVIQSVLKLPSRGKGNAPSTELTLEQYLKEAQNMSDIMYKDNLLLGDGYRAAFKAGARWGWGALHRKDK